MGILITGYPPFDAFPMNSTHQLIESMRGQRPSEFDSLRASIAFEVVDFDNTDSQSQQLTMLASYRRLIDQHSPDVCLFCGQAAARSWLTFETIAINMFKGSVIDPDGPAAYWATFPGQEDLVTTLQEDGIPAKLSYHAGTHLCNHILYTALHDAASAKRDMKAGFLHLPMTAEQVIACKEKGPFVSLTMMRRALTLAIQHLVGLPSQECPT